MKKIHRLRARRYRLREQQHGRTWPGYTESDAAVSRDQCGHSRNVCQRQAVTIAIYACDMHGSEQLVEILGHEE